jgi:hypothetical protein
MLESTPKHENGILWFPSSRLKTRGWNNFSRQRRKERKEYFYEKQFFSFFASFAPLR